LEGSRENSFLRFSGDFLAEPFHLQKLRHRAPRTPGRVSELLQELLEGEVSKSGDQVEGKPILCVRADSSWFKHARMTALMTFCEAVKDGGNIKQRVSVSQVFSLPTRAGRKA
jgi:hypothetical protein